MHQVRSVQLHELVTPSLFMQLGAHQCRVCGTAAESLRCQCTRPATSSHLLHVFVAACVLAAPQAPETMLRGKLSRSSDVYAFGVLLWELCTGGHAFKVSCRPYCCDSCQVAGFRTLCDLHCQSTPLRRVGKPCRSVVVGSDILQGPTLL